jgi:c-di-GMP-binding flagellar brake protein YcgR
MGTSKDSERRSYIRTQLHTPVILRAANGAAIRGKLANLSTGGALVELEHNYGEALPHDAVELTIEWSQNATPWIINENISAVIRHREDGQVGLQFNRLRGQAAA